MMDNERRADLGATAVITAATITNVARMEAAETAICDVLAYIAHFCDRCGLDPRSAFTDGLRFYAGDFEDGPIAARVVDCELPLTEQQIWAAGR
jgi:hypothetical protein